MKKLLCTLIILLAALSVHGQELEKTKKTKNEIGIEISDFFDAAIQIKYERLLGDHISVGLGVGYKGDGGLIGLSGLDTDQIKTDDITYSGLKIIPEIRYYINKTGQIGMDEFYFGAYLKYSNFRSDLNGTYVNSTDESFVLEFDADINITSIGFMVGYKLPVSKKFSIDFLIAGPGVGFHNYALTNKRDLPDEFYEDFNFTLDRSIIDGTLKPWAGDGELYVNGEKVDEKYFDAMHISTYSLAETFDVGMDTGTQVDPDYEGSPFKFTGVLDRVKITLTD